MSKGKELAKIMRKSYEVVIGKREDGFIVTDKQILVKMDGDQFREFFSKYNSYKSTVDIPFEFEGLISSAKDRPFTEANMNLDIIFNQLSEADKEVEFTDYAKLLDSGITARVYKAGEELGLIKEKYKFLFEMGDEYRTEGRKNSIFILNEGEIRAVLMPINNGDSSVREELKSLLGLKSDKKLAQTA
ncbi:hypothetical protein [Halarsenatibacter silvermanii]|uniref:Uncharacterized protein n=1 Tax=Halarsenatibacter silvermanii TaxID=321763 RepID=A0A1G9RWS3_9FIRM|nr:hypothetical protein [Halarsenatibacter silvermanii]SDM26935.1 hypothetical protein SAMN04488692_12413 [Halarsenatibacter silvermanii]